uniref:Uncharacterized protein n=1 Tax=Hippocampus comes TaxID=109280 RepID=A0A3Q2XPD8_HIPCM
MADKHLVQDLKLWATEEFNFPPESLPLCAGRGRSIWKYIINHVFQQRFVLKIIPSSWLSIHRLQSPTFSSLCQNMAFPLYRVSA